MPADKASLNSRNNLNPLINVRQLQRTKKEQRPQYRKGKYCPTLNITLEEAERVEEPVTESAYAKPHIHGQNLTGHIVCSRVQMGPLLQSIFTNRRLPGHTL